MIGFAATPKRKWNLELLEAGLAPIHRGSCGAPNSLLELGFFALSWCSELDAGPIAPVLRPARSCFELWTRGMPNSLANRTSAHHSKRKTVGPEQMAWAVGRVPGRRPRLLFGSRLLLKLSWGGRYAYIRIPVPGLSQDVFSDPDLG
jgi:hypothetical protein